MAKSSGETRIKIYQELSKSGIVFLVLISVISGYLLGQPRGTPLDWMRMGATLVGLLLLASGSSALNQYQDREMDSQMPRTSGRPIPSGRLSVREALLFSTLTLSFGSVILFALDPRLTLFGLGAVLFYNVLYTLWWKRRHPFAAIPGAIPGALPILMGYVASSGQPGSAGGWYLFSILFFWQMPHFWVLAIRFSEDYAKGGVPTLPVKHGAKVTRAHIVLWCLAYVGLSLLAPLFLPTVGALYLVTALLAGLWVLIELWRYLSHSEDPSRWLRFFLAVNFSLIVYLAAATLDSWRYLLGARFWIS